MATADNAGIVNIFFSLAPEDNPLFEKLRKHLMPLQRRGLINMQYDSLISAGRDFVASSITWIRAADIIALLVSSDFFDSDQCYEVEMKYAQEQHAAGAAHIITVLLRPTGWLSSPLAEHMLLPTDGKPVSIWDNLDSALAEVATGIHRIVEQVARHLTGTHRPVKPAQFPIFSVPQRRNPFFTDRQDTLAALHTYFAAPHTEQTRIQTLYGLGGMGKTQLALEYAYHYQGKYDAVLWLHATPRKLFSAEILSLARTLGIPAQDERDERLRIAAIQRWLHYHDRWLLILDNLEDLQIVKRLVPPESHGHVLLISHIETTDPAIKTVPVNAIDRDESALLLLRRAGIVPEQAERSAPTRADYQHALRIAQEVEGYPLALDQAGAYIKESQSKLTAYYTLYQEQQATLLGTRGTLASDHPDPVTTTLALTFARIKQMHPQALELLYLFAFLYPEALPNEMLRDGASTLSGTLRALADDKQALDAAINTLLKYSLVQHCAESTTLNIHRVIQATLRKQLPPRQQVRLARQALRLVNTVFPPVAFANQSVSERYLPQAQHCTTLLQDYQLTLQEGPLLLERLGSYYGQHGCYMEAESYLQQALQLQEKLTRTAKTTTAQILNALGLLYQRQARYQEAEQYHQRALALRQRVLGATHPKTAESLHNLALLYGDQGAYQRAEQIYQQVIALEEHARGPQDPDVARTLNNLALIYYHQGDYTRAASTYNSALAIYEQSLPTDHPDRIYTLDGLGALAEQEGQIQLAEQYYQQALTICQQAYGDTHPETAHCINKLADIAELKGKYQEAETRYQQALVIGEQALGPEHPDVALFLNNLGFVVHRQRQYQRARELYERALRIDEQALGPDHPDIASILTNLGKLFSATNDDERAEDYLRRALAIYEECLDATHLDLIQSRNDLADLLEHQHRYAEATQLRQASLQQESE